MVARWRPRDVEFDTTAVAGTAAVGAAVSRFTFYLIFWGGALLLLQAPSRNLLEVM